MAGFKVVIGQKDGRCVQKEVTEGDITPWFGKKINDIVKGELLGLAGYEFIITGGSDSSGFPMRKDVSGTARKKIFAVEGVGLKRTRRGMRVRKTVAGDTIYDKTSQINLKVTKEGTSPLIEPKKEAEDKSEPKKESEAKSENK